MITTLADLKALLEEFKDFPNTTPILIDDGNTIYKASFVSAQLGVEDNDENIHQQAIVVG
jgi:hypothetical protein